MRYLRCPSLSKFLLIPLIAVLALWVGHADARLVPWYDGYFSNPAGLVRPNTFCLTADDTWHGEDIYWLSFMAVINNQPGWRDIGYSITPIPTYPGVDPCANGADIEIRFEHLGDTWWAGQVWWTGIRLQQGSNPLRYDVTKFILQINTDHWLGMNWWQRQLVINHEFGHIVGPLDDRTDNTDCSLLMSYCWWVNMPSQAELQEVAAWYDIGKLLRKQGDPAVFLRIDGALIHIPSPNEFVRLGFNWSEVQDISPDDSRWQLPEYYPEYGIIMPLINMQKSGSHIWEGVLMGFGTALGAAGALVVVEVTRRKLKR